jgi:hypothetical protein
MGFRLFRRIRIAPGVSLNMSKSGFSVSAGVRGAHVTVGPRGVRRTVGLPGTGIYYTTTSSRAKAQQARQLAPDDQAGNDALLGQQQATGSGGCLLILLGAAIFFGIFLGSAGQVTPSGGSGSPTPSATEAPSLTPMPLMVSTDLPSTVARSTRITTHITTLPDARCTLSVPAAAHTGAAPKSVIAGIDGVATIQWRTGTTVGRFTIVATCVAGPESLSHTAKLRVR